MLWIKSFHVVAVMAWIAGVFYLPRIFVHYAEGRAAGEDVRRLVIMARRLFGFMTMMAAIAILLGLWMWLGFNDVGRWLMVKMVFVLGLVAYHGLCRLLLGRMQRGATMPSPLQLRLLNEAPLLLVVPIVLLAVMKPF
ncbi:MAG TPA: CopD family protein [Steroidobacteraceae bacterium]|jgi:putative membrane protein|nr:CopD family protein [Steroidobacteraceae bacterium]